MNERLVQPRIAGYTNNSVYWCHAQGLLRGVYCGDFPTALGTV